MPVYYIVLCFSVYRLMDLMDIGCVFEDLWQFKSNSLILKGSL